jgi:hypothetical protein
VRDKDKDFEFKPGSFFRCKLKSRPTEITHWHYFEVVSATAKGDKIVAEVTDVRTGITATLTGPFKFRGHPPYYEPARTIDPFLHLLEEVPREEARLHVEQAQLDHERKEVEAIEERNRHLDYCRQIETSAMEHLTVAEPMRIAAE